MSPRIVIATPLYPPEPGGPATYAKLLHEGLGKYEIYPTVVMFSDVRKHPKLLRHFLFAYRIFRASQDADLVLALDPVSVGFPVYLASLFSGKPYVVKIVGDYAWEQGVQRSGITDTLDEFVKRSSVPIFVSFLRFLQKQVAASARAVIVPSDYLGRIVRAWGVSPRLLTVIPNAQGAERIGKVPESVAVLPSPLIVTAGRLVPWKNIPGVIDAVAQIHTDGINASLVIVGDGPEREHLKEYGKRANAVFTGTLSHPETLAVIDRADVFVLNSSYEGLSHLLIEAVSLGVPVVATNVGGNPELIHHNHNGLLVGVGKTDELTSAIRHLFDRAEAERLTSGAAAFSEQFSETAMLSATATFLKSLI